MSCVNLNLRNKTIQSSQLLRFLPSSRTMATFRKERKLAAMARETHKEYPRNNQSQTSAAPGIAEDYIAQVSEEIEGGVTMRLSQKFSRTVSGILGALSKFDKFLLYPQIRTFSGTIPGIFRNAEVENQEPSGDRSQNDPHLEVEFSAYLSSNLNDSDPDETSHRTIRAKSSSSLVTFPRGFCDFTTSARLIPLPIILTVF